jgi:rare lipoprotein A
MFNGTGIRRVIWRLVAAGSASATMLAGGAEPGFAQQDFFDRDTHPTLEQPSFVRFSNELLVPPISLPPSESFLPDAESSWLDPRPAIAADSPSTRFVRPNEPSTTGAVTQPVSCPPNPPAPAPAAQAPEPEIAKPEVTTPEVTTPEVAKPEKLIGRGPAVWYELPGSTASGESYDPEGFTAGHRTLPFGARVRVVNEQNGRSTIVRINDRGPVQRKFVIDLSRRAARFLGISGKSQVSLYEVSSEDNSAQKAAQAVR